MKKSLPGKISLLFKVKSVFSKRFLHLFINVFCVQAHTSQSMSVEVRRRFEELVLSFRQWVMEIELSSSG